MRISPKALPNLLRHGFFAVSVLTLAACSGGGADGDQAGQFGQTNGAVTAASPVDASSGVQARAISLSDDNFIYTSDEALTFDVGDYLGEHYPLLAEYANTFTHWSGLTTVSPKVLIALIVTENSRDGGLNPHMDMERPFGELSEKVGFKEQLSDVASRLAIAFYEAKRAGVENKADFAVQTLRGARVTGTQARSATSAAPEADFGTHFFEAFPEETVVPTQRSRPMDDAQGAQGSQGVGQLPFPIGESWVVSGGSHNAYGQNGTMSSLDFTTANYPGEGQNTSNAWVTATHGGTVTVGSSCGLVITGDDGWSTSYYHLDNIRVRTGQRVAANARLANFTTNKAQALCEGGGWSGPHLHFTLMKNGQLYNLDGVEFSGYRVHNGRYNYDDDCAYFYLTKNGGKYCVGDQVYNPGATTSAPRPTQPAGPPKITSPANGSKLTSSTQVFGWENSDARLYVLTAGSRSGGIDYGYAYLSGDRTSITVTSVPIDGRTLYLRLWTLGADYNWRFSDTYYVTGR